MITIGLLWHSLSSDNLGVGALSESQIAICQSAAQRAGGAVKYVVFGTEGSSSYAPSGVSLSYGGSVSIKKMLIGHTALLRELDRCDIVFDIGEGDSFTDIYGFKRFLSLIVSKIAVLIKGKPLVLSPQTIGPFEHWYTRAISTVVMRRCQKVFARDGLSFEYLRKIGVGENIEEGIDVAFRLPFARPASRSDGRIRIGVNVSGLLYSGGYAGGNQFGLTLDYPALIHRLLVNWTATPENEVWLIPHVIPDNIPNDDDRVAIGNLLKIFPNVNRAPDFDSPGEAKSFIAGMDFVTGARMHACIAAFSSGVPVVPLAYSRKFNGLFASLGFPYVADAKMLTTDQAYEVILDGFNQRAKLAQYEKLGNQIAEEKLERYEQFIMQIIQNKRM